MASRTLKVEILGDASRYQRTMDQVDRSMGKLERSNVRFGASMRRFGAVSVAAFGGAGVALGGFAVAGAALGLKTAANLESAEIGFKRLLGSGKQAKSFLEELKSFAAKTPFELPGLVDASRALLGAGVEAKKVIPIMSALGDASGALGLDQERFGRVMTAVTQIMNKGKVQAEELMQINEAGIPVWQLLAKATGKPVPELQKLMEQGKLLASDTLPLLFDQMRKDYGGGMVEQSKSLNGVWSTFKDTISLTLSDALQPLIPVLKKNLPEAAETFKGAVEGVVRFFQEDLGPALDDAKGWWDDNRTAVRGLGDALSLFFMPAADEATTSTKNLSKSAGDLRRTLDGMLEFMLRVAQGFLHVAVAAGTVRDWVLRLGIGVGLLINAIDKLSGGSGHAADSMVRDFRQMRDEGNRKLQEIRDKIKDTQRTIDGLHGKTIPITATAGVEIKESTRRGLLALGIKGYGTKFFARGGKITEGTTPTADDVLIRASKHETVVSAEDSRDPWFKGWAQAKRIPGYAAGGIIGGFLDPATRATRRYGELAAAALGKAAGKELGKAVANAALFTGGSGAGFGSGSWIRAIRELQRERVPFGVISTFRAGARTAASGSVSFHALNRAVDLVGPNMLRIWQALTDTSPTELIYSRAPMYKSRRGWNPIGQLDSITRANHFSHVHAAYGNGGRIPEDVFGVGARSGRTYGFHGGETVVPQGGGGDVHVHLHGPVYGDRSALVREIRYGLKSALEREGKPLAQQL